VAVGPRFRAAIARATVPTPSVTRSPLCPKCTRPLAGSLPPSGVRATSTRLRMTTPELVDRCPVDGTLFGRRRPTGRTGEELDAGTAEIVVQLLALGEQGWAAMVQEGFEHPPGPLRSLYLGHALALVRHRSDQTNLRGDWSRLDQARLQQLVVDYVSGWRPQRPDRPGVGERPRPGDEGPGSGAGS
jgi:hypothetical protein